MIEFRGVRKTFEDPSGAEIVAVAGLDLRIHDGETHCLIGTSGCGKTTTLRLVNRLEDPTRGVVQVGGIDVRKLDVFELRRSIGYVIQSGGLFPHMTIERNVGILCELEKWPEGRIRERVHGLLELVGLAPGEFRRRYPAELSGGQRQRVGVARALALDPEYVLMDEPFGALDPITRSEIHAEFVKLLEKVHKTVVIVTHDLGEAFKLGDQVSVMHAGKLVRTGTEEELLQEPEDSFVGTFLREHASQAQGE